MTSAPESDSVELLVFSDDSDTRKQVIEAVGRRPDKGLPRVTWFECATAEAVRLALKENPSRFAALVFDSEVKKFGGMGLAHELLTEMDSRPAVVMLTARPQDGWLSAWAHADAVVSRPLDPVTVAQAVAQAMRKQLAK